MFPNVRGRASPAYTLHHRFGHATNGMLLAFDLMSRFACDLRSGYQRQATETMRDTHGTERLAGFVPIRS
jgi:hypothetical protein